MSKYIQPLPPLTLFGGITSSSPKTLYGIDDGSGLSDIYKSYDVTISIDTPQYVGDNNINTYTGLDIKVGDWISSVNGLIILKITSISNKSFNSITLTVEDIGMAIARIRSNKNNNPSLGTSVVIFRVNDDNTPIFAIDRVSSLTINNAIDQIQSYFSIYPPLQTFPFTPLTTEGIQVGDLVSITESGDWYNLITSSLSDEIVGTVSEIESERVIIRPFNKIITNYDAPENLLGGGVGTIWYESGSGQITLDKTLGGDKKYLQLTPPISTSIVGTVSDPTFNPVAYNLLINNVEVIPQNPAGTTLNLNNIVSNINNYTSQTQVIASIDIQGGLETASTLGDAGEGGENGTIKFPSVLNGVVVVLGSGGVGEYPNAPGKFSITASNISFEIHPTTANVTYSTFAIANEEQIAQDINEAASIVGAPVLATYNEGSVTITVTDGGDLAINKVSPMSSPNSTDLVGLNSAIGLPTGEFSTPPEEHYLSLSREGGGEIFIEGSWLTSGNSDGIYSISGTPPYLLILEGSSGGADTDWFEGDTYLSASKDVRVTGSLLVTRDNADADFLIISSGSYDAFKVNSEGIAQFFAYEDTDNPIMTPEYGGLLFMSSSVWVAIDAE